MAKLSTLTDYYEPETMDSLPVDNPYVPVADPTRRVPVYSSEPQAKPEEDVVDTNTTPSKTSVVVDKILNKLFRDDDKRYQLWPEKVVREALAAGHDVMKEGTNLGLRREDITDIPAPDMPTKDSTWLGEKLGIAPVAASPQDKIIEQGQAVAALAGSGGLGGVTDATLGATPFLRPALKYKDKLYKGKEGQQHMDVIPETLYPEFQKMAMSGEDISHYNFGFVNDKGHFLDREKALRYAIDTGMVDKFAGQYGALTSTLLADSTKPGMAIEAMGKSNAPTFYSAVEHNLNKIPQSKMTGDQWLGTLANKPGVKPEELDWTGLRQYLQDNKGKAVTKEQIEQHLASNKVELKEVNKGKVPLSEEEVLRLKELNKKADDGTLSPTEELAWESLIQKSNDGIGNTKYHSYQLPGGENYREMLLTLPIDKEKYAKSLIDPAVWERMSVEQRNEFMSAPIKGDGKTTYKSSHWDEPNILAHVRMNDRDIGGKKSLHLEEIQSDWHQQGRDRGYRPENEKRMAELVAKRDSMIKEVQDKMLSPLNERYKEIYKELPTIQTEINKLGSSDVGVPDAPFKKNWHELALKRMIREAAEKGYDRLSWTPGEAQAARYDLSKQLKELQYLKNDDGTYQIAGVTKDGGGFNHPDNVPANKLPDIVGKEMAEKIIKNEGRRARGQPSNGGYFEGVDLKIGGEGMKGFYDQIIPKALEKLGKEHGVKVKTDSLPHKVMQANPHDWRIVDSNGKGLTEPNGSPMLYGSKEGAERAAKELGQKIHYIDLPQSLKDQAIGKGFPLFSNRYMFTPVDYEPEFK